MGATMRANSEGLPAFRGVAGQIVTGVSVVVTMIDGEPFATTATSVVAASWEPPLLAVLFQRGSRMDAALDQAGEFTVNLLRDADHGLGRRFARTGRAHGWAALSGVPLQRRDPSPPRFRNAVASAACLVTQVVLLGDHRCFVGEVMEAERDETAEPLAYYRGRFRGLGSVLAPAAWTTADLADLAAVW